jgi:heat shock protein HslJ
MTPLRARLTLLALPFVLAACAPVLGLVGAPTQTVVLPDGEVCGYAGEGATLAFDGVRLGWTCDVAATGPRGLFGAPTVVRETDVYWRIGTTARRADGAGFELARLEAVEARVARMELSSGETCAFAGEGATMAFDGRRVHYTCDGDVVLVGPLTPDERGLLATRATLLPRAGGFELRRERLVRVRSAILGDAAAATTGDAPGAAAGAPAPAARDHAPLLGTTWALQRIRFADGGELLPPDPALYTLALGADGSVALRADCNRGAGRFELDGERLTFAPFATTRAACPPGSLEQPYLAQLGSALSFAFEGGRLVVVTALEASRLEFEPLP